MLLSTASFEIMNIFFSGVFHYHWLSPATGNHFYPCIHFHLIVNLFSQYESINIKMYYNFFSAFACNVKSFVIVFLFLLYLLLNSFFGWTYELFYQCFRDCYPGHLVTQDRHHYRNNFIGQTGDSLFRSLQLI